MLHPFSRGKGKSLGANQIATLCEALAPLPVVIVGRAETGLGSLSGSVLNLLNRTTIAELVGLIRRAAFVISVDSGPMHIAAAITDRLVSIHTWSDPRRVGPYAPGALVWKGGKLQAMGEYRAAGLKDRAPTDAELREIAARVLDAWPKG